MRHILSFKADAKQMVCCFLFAPPAGVLTITSWRHSRRTHFRVWKYLGFCKSLSCYRQNIWFYKKQYQKFNEKRYDNVCSISWPGPTGRLVLWQVLCTLLLATGMGIPLTSWAQAIPCTALTTDDGHMSAPEHIELFPALCFFLILHHCSWCTTRFQEASNLMGQAMQSTVL